MALLEFGILPIAQQKMGCYDSSGSLKTEYQFSRSTFEKNNQKCAYASLPPLSRTVRHHGRDAPKPKKGTGSVPVPTLYDSVSW